MQFKVSTIFAALLVQAIILLQAEARPYFYYTVAEPEQHPIDAIQQGAGQAAQQVATEAKKVTDQVGQQARQAQNYVNGAVNNANPHSQGFTGHLGSLYEHGSSAMRSVLETVRPDIAGIGHDIRDFVVQTSDNVNKKMQPIGQTIRPYIDQAQNIVTPFVNQAKEEVPKLIERAGPTLNKAKDTLSSAWGKLSSTVSSATNQAQQAIQQATHPVQQQPGEGIANVAAQATNPDALK